MAFRFKSSILACLLLSAPIVAGDAVAPLKKDDVKKIMTQIFSQHVEQKKITSKIIRKSLKVYIDQFDPDRTYLLDVEVQPFLNPSVSGLDTYLEEYEKNNFEIYEKLNKVIQTAISRARVNRIVLFDDRDKLFQESLNVKADPNEEMTDPDLNKGFAKSNEELLKRQRNQILQFLAAERAHYGNQEVNRNPKATLGVLNKSLMSHENQYLFQDAAGKSLTAQQTENLLTLHILKSLSSSLDAHTTVYDPTEAYDMKVRLQKGFQGIGVILKKGSNGEVKIASFVKGGPAEASKQLEINDQIIAIEGKDITQDSFDQVMEQLKGKNSPAVKITVKRAVQEGGKTVDKKFDVQLQRAPITLHEERVQVDVID